VCGEKYPTAVVTVRTKINVIFVSSTFSVVTNMTKKQVPKLQFQKQYPNKDNRRITYSSSMIPKKQQQQLEEQNNVEGICTSAFQEEFTVAQLEI